MRGRVKPGMREKFERLMRDLSLAHVAEQRGLHSVELAFEDANPDRLVMLLNFHDRESYLRNAEYPQTQRNYERWAPLLEGEPEWTDVSYVDYIGHALTQTVIASAS